MTPFSSYAGAFAQILVMDTKASCEGGGGNPLLNVQRGLHYVIWLQWKTVRLQTIFFPTLYVFLSSSVSIYRDS